MLTAYLRANVTMSHWTIIRKICMIKKPDKKCFFSSNPSECHVTMFLVVFPLKMIETFSFLFFCQNVLVFFSDSARYVVFKRFTILWFSTNYSQKWSTAEVNGNEFCKNLITIQSTGYNYIWHYDDARGMQGGGNEGIHQSYDNLSFGGHEFPCNMSVMSVCVVVSGIFQSGAKQWTEQHPHK